MYDCRNSNIKQNIWFQLFLTVWSVLVCCYSHTLHYTSAWMELWDCVNPHQRSLLSEQQRFLVFRFCVSGSVITTDASRQICDWFKIEESYAETSGKNTHTLTLFPWFLGQSLDILIVFINKNNEKKTLHVSVRQCQGYNVIRTGCANVIRIFSITVCFLIITV